MAIEGTYRHPLQGRVITRIERVPAEVVSQYRRYYSAFILDHVGKQGSMSPRIQPLALGTKLCGTAVTALGPDLSIRRMAINVAEAGDVLVVAAGGNERIACFGDGTSQRMMLKNMEGAVIDGMTRDAAGIRQLGFPVFARGTTPQNFHYPEAPDAGGVNVPVVCGGVLVHPGDLVMGDDDGIVVVPRSAAVDLLNAVDKNFQKERSYRQNMTEFEPFPVEQELKQRGYVFE